MLKKKIKAILRFISNKLPMRFVPLDGLLWLLGGLTAKVASLLFFRDWILESQGRPQFFKHQMNIGRWPSEPDRWSFCARGVYSRENMFDKCKVLDVCCGDGSYSYMFFSDIAASIDAIDNDEYALKYAKKYSSRDTINYHLLDIISMPMPSSNYDFIIWNAAICYFDNHDIDLILRKFIDAGTSEMILTGMLPKSNGWVDHKTEFSEAAEVKELLLRYFKLVDIKEVSEGQSSTFYFKASNV